MKDSRDCLCQRCGKVTKNDPENCPNCQQEFTGTWKGTLWCENCGHEVDTDDEDFCSYCGDSLD